MTFARLLICVNNVLVLVVLTSTALESGERCYTQNGQEGICAEITVCESARRELQSRQRPVICGFDQSYSIYPIVCCTDNTDGSVDPNPKFSTRISEQKCEEYRKINEVTTTTTPRTWNTENSVLFAVGGVDAQSQEFPHMAILGYGNDGELEWQCGGSLISEQFVLTAAHCLYSRRLGDVTRVRLGDLDIASDTDSADPQEFNVLQAFAHPQYTSISFYNDIGLIKLDRPAEFTKYVKPACLQTVYELETNDLTATGWGATESGGDIHSFLQKVRLIGYPVGMCLPTYGPQASLDMGIEDETQICAGNLQEVMDTCQGDSGGPLQMRMNTFPAMHKIVGVTSFGKNCGLVPGVYTRVSRFIDWIESTVWPN